MMGDSSQENKTKRQSVLDARKEDSRLESLCAEQNGMARLTNTFTLMELGQALFSYCNDCLTIFP